MQALSTQGFSIGRVFILSFSCQRRGCADKHTWCWLTDGPWKSECIVGASHISCSKHERKGERWLSGGAAGEVQEQNTSQQKLSLISTYQCERQILLFLSYQVDMPVIIFNSRELYTIAPPLLLLTWYPRVILIFLHTWNNECIMYWDSPCCIG